MELSFARPFLLGILRHAAADLTVAQLESIRCVLKVLRMRSPGEHSTIDLCNRGRFVEVANDVRTMAGYLSDARHVLLVGVVVGWRRVNLVGVHRAVQRVAEVDVSAVERDRSTVRRLSVFVVRIFERGPVFLKSMEIEQFTNSPEVSPAIRPYSGKDERDYQDDQDDDDHHDRSS